MRTLSPSLHTHSSLLVSALLAWPWLQPWAPGPETNTVPLLMSWAAFALLVLAGRWPSALELARGWAWAALAMMLSLPGVLT